MKAKDLKDIDFAPLRRMAIDHIKGISNKKYHKDNEDKHYMYAELMEAVYGRQIWHYINSK